MKPSRCKGCKKDCYGCDGDAEEESIPCGETDPEGCADDSVRADDDACAEGDAEYAYWYPDEDEARDDDPNPYEGTYSEE
jgi:hypothetical protein